MAQVAALAATGLLAGAPACPLHTTESYYQEAVYAPACVRCTQPRMQGPAKIRPFVILFDGSAGSSWFVDSLDRHADIFIAGYEPLEWVGHDEHYMGWNATAWQASWLRTIWTDPPLPHAQLSSWQRWLQAYQRNEKLDPAVHHAPLTVRTPSQTEVTRARAIGFKVRPLTIESNHLDGTLRHALQAQDGVVLTINRRDKLAQAVSLYRRRFDGKVNQFASRAPVTERALAAARWAAEQADAARAAADGAAQAASGAAAKADPSPGRARRRATSAAGATSGEGGAHARPMPMKAADATQPTATAASGSHIPPAELERMLDHRESQQRAIECMAAFLGRPTLAIAYEDLLANFTGTLRAALAHVGIDASIDDAALNQLSGSPPSAPPSRPQLQSQPQPPQGEGASPASVNFVKRSPSTLCESVTNLRELCAHFSSGRHAAHFAQLRASGGCDCPGRGQGRGTASGATSGTSGATTASLRADGGLLQAASSTATWAVDSSDAGAVGGGDSSRDLVPPLGSALSVVGAHHKTGTVLMGQVLRTATHRLGAWMLGPNASDTAPAGTSLLAGDVDVDGSTGTASPVLLIRRNWSTCVDHAARGGRAVCLLEHARWATLGPAIAAGVRFVHMIRDPLEVCVSGYQCTRHR